VVSAGNHEVWLWCTTRVCVAKPWFASKETHGYGRLRTGVSLRARRVKRGGPGRGENTGRMCVGATEAVAAAPRDEKNMNTSLGTWEWDEKALWGSKGGGQGGDPTEPRPVPTTFLPLFREPPILRRVKNALFRVAGRGALITEFENESNQIARSAAQRSAA
jgi:hypothetical protein